MSAGLLHSAQGLLASVLALGRTRLELFSTELEEEIARQAAALLGAFFVLILAALAAAFGALAILIAAGEAYRLTAALGMVAFFGLCAAVAAFALRKAVRAKAPAFHASLAQLEHDHRVLEP